MTKAKAAVRDYLQRNAGTVIGGSDWGPESGRVRDHQGEIVARFSFNLRCLSSDDGREFQVK